MISISHYLYRNSGRRAIPGLLLLALLGLCSAAQVLQDHTHDQTPPPSNETKINAKPKKRGPRAIGVVEFLPGGKARLVPVALWIDGKYYDASLYSSNPEPMAIEPETVYEATDYGEPTGLFTVTQPQQVNGNWVADGHWKPHLAFDEKMAKQAANAKKPLKKEITVNTDPDRPVLKRSSPKESGDDSSSGSNNAPPNSDDNDPDRPVLKSSTPRDSSPSSSPSSVAAIVEHLRRSRLLRLRGRRWAAQPIRPPDINRAAAPDNPSANDQDPGRPVLRRGKQQMSPDELQAPNIAANKTPSPAEQAQVKLMATMASLGHRSYPAISDAGKYDTRSLLYAMGATERQEKAQQMSVLALQDLQKFISQRKTPPLPKNAAITDFDLRGYDLDFTNSPTLVYTASIPVENAKPVRGTEFAYYVTVVAREDVNGQPIKIFSQVTDSNHLDAFSRMEIIDAVDADANGRGDLLFREHSDVGVSYGLYRVYPYQLQRVFEGGSGL